MYITFYLMDCKLVQTFTVMQKVFIIFQTFTKRKFACVFWHAEIQVHNYEMYVMLTVAMFFKYLSF